MIILIDKTIKELKKRVKYIAAFIQKLMIPPQINTNFIDKVNVDEYECIFYASNNILKLNANGRIFYFRQCRKHYNKKEYVLGCIADFFELKLIEPSIKKTFIEELSKEQNYNKLISLGTKFDKTSNISLFKCSNNYTMIGMGFVSGNSILECVAKELAEFLWSELYSYELNSHTKEYQIYNSSKSLAQEAMAELLGLNIIPHSSYALIEGKHLGSRIGTIMAEAEGLPISSLERFMSEGKLSPNLQNELNNLNILDVICYEKDHRPGNYNIVIKDDHLFGIRVYDNDSPMCFFPTPNIKFKTYADCSPLVKKGMINRPHLDQDTAERIIKTSNEMIIRELKQYLNNIQIFFTILRFNKLKRAIIKTSKRNHDFLITPSEWNSYTIQEELSGKYGKTYLSLLLKK